MDMRPDIIRKKNNGIFIGQVTTANKAYIFYNRPVGAGAYSGGMGSKQCLFSPYFATDLIIVIVVDKDHFIISKEDVDLVIIRDYGRPFSIFKLLKTPDPVAGNIMGVQQHFYSRG